MRGFLEEQYFINHSECDEQVVQSYGAFARRPPNINRNWNRFPIISDFGSENCIGHQLCWYDLLHRNDNSFVVRYYRDHQSSHYSHEILAAAYCSKIFGRDWIETGVIREGSGANQEKAYCATAKYRYELQLSSRCLTFGNKTYSSKVLEIQTFAKEHSYLSSKRHAVSEDMTF